ncbi:MAG: hypothetical protein Kow0092_20190 [Deferrisomatales bacterium]
MNRPFRLLCAAASLALLCRCAGAAPDGVRRVAVPRRATQALERCGTIASPLIRESSGLVRSRRFPDIYWTHNDSGDEARLFALRRDGTPVEGPAGPAGIRVRGARNVDWEDIAADDAGHLFLGDIGNNANTRRDLVVYVIDEPDPAADRWATPVRRLPFHYPDQDGFPPSRRNFDAEALFWARGRLYLITKHRSDPFATLYRFDEAGPEGSTPLTLLSAFDTRGQVTAADASPDGRRLAVLTYGAVWVFERPPGSDDYFQGAVSWMPIRARQCEALCWDGDRLLLGNEQGEIYCVDPRELTPLGR